VYQNGTEEKMKPVFLGTGQARLSTPYEPRREEPRREEPGQQAAKGRHGRYGKTSCLLRPYR